jgi:putative ABC transport system permease protein
MVVALIVALLTQSIDSTRSPDQRSARPRAIAIDDRLARDAKLEIGDRVLLSSQAGAAGDTAIVDAIVKRSADPAEIARGEYRVRLHLDHLQRLAAYGDRVDRFAVATNNAAATDTVLARINRAAFGFQAHRSRDIAIQTSQTFLVVSRFLRAIGVITIVASAIFLLCIMLLKVDERRRDVAALQLIGISAATITRSVMIEAALVAALGSAIGVGIGWIATLLINWHYRGVYRTPLAFAIATPGIIAAAVVLSLVLGLVAGYAAAQRLVRTPPLTLLSGRRA